jgi:acyl-coenzyme A thioesterase PaaI-like protein
MTVDLSTQFIGTTTGVLVAEGRVMRAGQTTIFCEGEAKSEAGDLVAKSIGTFRARSPK